MNPLREMIMNEIVRPAVRNASKTFLGTIESYNSTLNAVDVRIGLLGDELYKLVPFSHEANYIHGAAPKMGTPVIVSFLGGDMSYPYVTVILGSNAESTGTGKKTMMPDVTMSVAPVMYTQVP